MTASSFEIGETVVDRDAPTSVPRIVVALPATAAADWITYGGTTVAQDNPAYPADASLVIVIDVDAVATYLPEWDHETALPRSTLDERGVYYEAVPAPRLTTDKETPIAE
jgi:hypothetical protein